MWRTFFLLSVCFRQVVVAVVQDVTLNFTDPALSVDPGWRPSVSQDSDGLFFFTDTLGKALTITLPEFTYSLTYISLKRTGGSVYGVCLDCQDGNPSGLQAFSGHDNALDNNADAVPTTIFSLTIDPTQRHTLDIINIPDNTFGGTSELTFVTIIVSVSAPEVSTSTSATSSSSMIVSSTSASSSSSISSSTSASASSQSASATAAPASQPTSGVEKTSLIAIITSLTLLAVLSLALGLFFYFRNNRRRSPFEDMTAVSDPPSLTQPVMAPPTPTPSGPLASAGRKKPPIRLPEPYPYQFAFETSQGGPILPVRRPDSR